MAETVVALSEAVERKGSSIRRLLRLLFGSKSENKDRLFGKKRNNDADPPGGAPSGKTGGEPPKPRAKGHGRNGAAAYTGAERVSVGHPDLQVGAPCPECNRGKLYELDPSPMVHVHAQPPITATIYECQRLRCNTCGKVSTAPGPAGVALRKYDRSVGVLIALLKYGSGMPFARLENLERMAGIPLPASVQWEQVAETATPFSTVLDALELNAAQGQVVHNDHTGMKVLLANCLSHARREFVDLIEAFPEPCRYVIDQLAEVYKNDAYTREQNMDPQARLPHHQQHSKKWGEMVAVELPRHRRGDRPPLTSLGLSRPTE